MRILEVLGMLVVLAAVLFMFVYQPPGAGNNDETVTLAGREPDRLGLNLNPTIWGRYFIGSERALPFRDKVAYVSLFAVFVGFIYARRRRLIEDPGAVFSLIVLLTYGLLLMLFIKHTAARYWFAMLPLFVVVASAGLVAFVRAYGPRAGRRIVVATKGSGRVYGALAVGLVVAAIAGYVTLGAPKWDQIVKASGPPCWGQGWRCDKSIEEHHAALRPSIGPQDTIIASNPWITNYYLGRVDGFLRERVQDGGYTQFDFETDDYFGVPLIDSVDELAALRSEPRRLWIVTDNKVEWASSQETRDFLQTKFEVFLQGPIMTTYVSCLNDACSGASAASVQ